MKILIIEDDLHAADFIKQLLSDYYPLYRVVGIATSVKMASRLFQQYQPDLLIMDINLGNHTSFDLFEYINTSEKAIIFTSSYQEYALRAFKVDALDYLIKPIDIKEFRNAINKVKSYLEYINMKKLVDPENNAGAIGKRLVESKILIFENEQLITTFLNEIIKIKSDGSYSNIYLIGNRILTNSKRLGLLEKLFFEKNFVRLHKSCIVNTDYVTSYTPGSKAYVTMIDGSIEYISKGRKKEFLKFYKNH